MPSPALKRSAAAIASALLLNPFWIAFAGCAKNPPPAAPARPPAKAVVSLDSFAGFGFEIPAGWERASDPNNPGAAAYIVMKGRNTGDADGELRVDVDEAEFPTARESVASLAREEPEIRFDSVSIDGVEGIKFELPVGAFTAAQYIAIAVRNGKKYSIWAGANKRAKASAAWEHVLKTWRWNSSH
jgi:hypothetical protein